MDILEIIKSRHSVRQYKDQPIEQEKRAAINACVNEIKAESGLAIQVFYEEPKCFDSFMAHYGKFENVKIISPSSAAGMRRKRRDTTEKSC